MKKFQIIRLYPEQKTCVLYCDGDDNLNVIKLDHENYIGGYFAGKFIDGKIELSDVVSFMIQKNGVSQGDVVVSKSFFRKFVGFDEKMICSIEVEINSDANYFEIGNYVFLLEKSMVPQEFMNFAWSKTNAY